MTLQLEIEGIAPASIATPKGRMKFTTLRPGDYLETESPTYQFKIRVCVLINSAKLQRLVVRFDDGEEVSCRYESFIQTGPGYWYIGRGTKRRWLQYLPKFLSKRICPFNRPRP